MIVKLPHLRLKWHFAGGVKAIIVKWEQNFRIHGDTQLVIRQSWYIGLLRP